MGYSIADTCSRTGLSADTLRYYERIGLLRRVARNAGGHRRYNDGELRSLRFIRRAQAMDFSLAEIGELLRLREAAGDVRGDVRSLTELKLTAVEQRIAELSALRDELHTLVEKCRNSSGCCPIIQRIDTDEDYTDGPHGRG